MAVAGAPPRSFTNLAWANLAAQSAEQLSLAATPIVAVLLLSAGPGHNVSVVGDALLVNGLDLLAVVTAAVETQLRLQQVQQLRKFTHNDTFTCTTLRTHLH